MLPHKIFSIEMRIENLAFYSFFFFTVNYLYLFYIISNLESVNNFSFRTWECLCEGIIVENANIYIALKV
jgi:hypothetical protein